MFGWVRWPPQFIAALTGGRGGSSDPDKVYLDDSITSSKSYSPAVNEWIIPNDTGYPLLVQSYNTSGKEVYSDVIGLESYDPMKVTFNKSIAGTAVYSSSGYMPDSPRTGAEWKFVIAGTQKVLVQAYSSDPSEGMMFPDIIQEDSVVTVKFAKSVTGWPVLVKAEAEKTFVDSDEWVFQHNLGRRVVAQAYLPTTGQVLGEVTYVDKNTVKMSFESPLTGYMIVA